MNKTLKISLIIIMILSILANIVLFFSIGILSLDYEEEVYLTSLEWCELSNDYIGAINDLIGDLRYYNEEYNQIDYLNSSDCWIEVRE